MRFAHQDGGAATTSFRCLVRVFGMREASPEAFVCKFWQLVVYRIRVRGHKHGPNAVQLRHVPDGGVRVS